MAKGITQKRVDVSALDVEAQVWATKMEPLFQSMRIGVP
jgi:hypothetical protein